MKKYFVISECLGQYSVVAESNSEDTANIEALEYKRNNSSNQTYVTQAILVMEKKSYLYNKELVKKSLSKDKQDDQRRV